MNFFATCRVVVKRLGAAFICTVCLMPASVLAQRQIGVDWHVPDNAAGAQAELQYFAERGISHLQVNQMLDEATWQKINELNFTVFGKLPLDFPITQTFTDSVFVERLQQFAAHYNEQPPVQAITIFSYGPRGDPRFINTIGDFIEQVHSTTKKPLCYLSARAETSAIDSLFDFKMISLTQFVQETTDSLGGYFYRPPPTDPFYLGSVKRSLQLTADRPGRPLFFDSVWLQNMIQQHPDFANTLKLYATSPEPVFPLPKHGESYDISINVAILILLFAWIIFAVTYSYNPVYRKSLVRYFTGHKFYVKDVMKRHIRNMFSGISILIQHGLSGGIVFYCLYSISFSALGRQAINYHYSFLGVWGIGPLALFFWGFGLTLTIELLSILWLRLANPKIGYVSQILNLYPWLLQVNLIAATLMLAVVLTQGRPILIYFLSSLFVLFFIGAFVVTAFDTSRYLPANRYRYLAGTTGLYIVLIVVLIGWVLSSAALLNVIDLASSLP